ncbi:MAG: hypothetical protein ACXABY_24355 [Candidatus Thorarchaeota archaeon]
MADVAYKYWTGADEFLKADARRLLPDMLAYDEQDQSDWSDNCKLAIGSLDKSIAQFIAVLQKLYRSRDKWEGTQNGKAAVAMANSTLNYHLLARHAVVLGYAAETEPLHRACFERMTRCAAFQLSTDLAERFWSGKQIQQKQVGDLLSKSFEDRATGLGEIANDRIKDMYKNLSHVSHPNLKTIQLRTIQTSEEAERNVGIDSSYCGEKQELLRLMSIGECMSYVIFSLFMLEIVSRKVFGSWGNVLQSKIQTLFEEHDSLFAHIIRSMKPAYRRG